MALTEKNYIQINQALFSLTHAYERRMEAEESAARSGLSLVDCSVIMVVGQFEPLNAARLSELMDINPGTISVYVQRLVEKGFIKKKQDKDDRRTWWITLTTKGRIAYKFILEGTVGYTKDFLSALSPEEQTQLYALLLKAVHALGFDWE